MRKKSTFYKFIFILLFCFPTTFSFGQYLYEDAQKIYHALESKSPILTIESNSITKVYFKDKPLKMLFPPLDSIKLSEFGMYKLDFSERPQLIQLRIDTTLYTDILFNQIKLDVNQIKLLKNGKTIQKVENEAYIQILSTVHAYTNNENLNLQSILDNPYFSTLIPSNLGRITPNNQKKIHSIAKHKKALLNDGLSLLYADSLLNDETLLSIKSIQMEHSKPSKSPEESFQNMVEEMRPTKGSFSTTTFLAGLSDFIVDRAQEEFNITFLENLKEKLEDPAYQELAILFPDSKQFLNNIIITDYKSFIPQARAIFINDAENLFFNFPKVLKLEKYVGKELSLQPIIYDLMTLYSMVDLVQREIPVDTILPYTYNNIIQTQKDVQKDIYRSIAQQISPKSLENFQNLVEHHVSALIQEKTKLLEKIDADLQNYFDKTDLSKEQKEILFQVYNAYNQFKKTKLFSEEQNKYLGPWEILKTIPTNLHGELFYPKYIIKPDINQFSTLFSENPDTIQLISAGFELTEKITSSTKSRPSRAKLLSDFYQIVADAKIQLDLLEQKRTDTMFIHRVENFIAQKDALITNIKKQKNNWIAAGKSNHQIQALAFIQKATSRIKTKRIKNLTNLEQVENEYHTITDKLIDYLIDQEENNNEKYDLLIFLQENQLDQPTVSENENVQKLVAEAHQIEQELKDFKKQYSNNLLIAQTNLNVLGNLVETNSQLLNLFKVNPKSGHKWIQKTQQDELLSNKKLQNIFLGLVYQQLKNLKPNNTISPSGMASFTSQLMQEMGHINVAYKNIKSIQKTDSLDTNFKDYYPILRSMISLMDISINTPLFVQPQQNTSLIGLFEKDTSYLKLFPKITNTTLDLFDNTYEKHYNYALYNIVELLDLLIDVKYSKKTDEKSVLEKRKLKTVQKYGNFFTQVAVADNAHQVNAALNAVALPPGSSRMKRQTRMSITVNGYFGFNFGNEQYTNPNLTKLNKKSLNTFGISVPIGISVNGKIKDNNLGSWSFFVPIIDIGMITAYRLDNKEGTLPETSFRNVLAPGAFILRNFQKSPFSLGFGLQFGPQNRNVDYINSTFNTSAIRYTIMGGIDIPFFNLFQAKDFK